MSSGKNISVWLKDKKLKAQVIRVAEKIKIEPRQYIKNSIEVGIEEMIILNNIGYIKLAFLLKSFKDKFYNVLTENEKEIYTVKSIDYFTDTISTEEGKDFHENDVVLVDRNCLSLNNFNIEFTSRIPGVNREQLIMMIKKAQVMPAKIAIKFPDTAFKIEIDVMGEKKFVVTALDYRDFPYQDKDIDTPEKLIDFIENEFGVKFE